MADLIRRCLLQDPLDRPTARDVVEVLSQADLELEKMVLRRKSVRPIARVGGWLMYIFGPLPAAAPWCPPQLGWFAQRPINTFAACNLCMSGNDREAGAAHRSLRTILP